MKLQISPLQAGENSLKFSSSSDEWLNSLMRQIEERSSLKVTAPVQVELCLNKIEPEYYLTGKLELCPVLPCARCAEPFTFPICHNFHMIFNHLRNGQSNSKNTDEEEQLDICYFSGNEIELDPIIEEQLFLSMPYQPLCNEGCLGLCQTCGKNLNQSECRCAKNTSLSQSSVFSQFKH